MTPFKESWQNNERKILLAVAFVCVFALGFFAGRIDSASRIRPEIKIEKSDNKSSILIEQSQAQESVTTEVLGTNTAPESCKIKGNISSSSRIYHVPGGAFYERTQPEMCFNTEAEAQAAGFRKSSR